MSRSCLDCGAVIPRGPRCEPCERIRNIARGSSHARGYDRHWRVLSERYRRLTPFCELRFPGCQLAAADTDHRVPIRAGGRSTWANACAVCRPCHAIKTAEDRERYTNAA